MSDVSGLPPGVGGFTTGITPTEDVAAMSRGLAAAVGSGQVTLDQDTGERLVKALDAHFDQVEGWLGRASSLSRFAPLGANPVSASMSDLFSKKADNGSQSFVQVLTAYRDALDQARRAVSTAITNFQQVDADRAATFAKIY